VLALFFRVVLSPYGRGHLRHCLGAPDEAAGWPGCAEFFIMNDNQRFDALDRRRVGHQKMPTFGARLVLGDEFGLIVTVSRKRLAI